MRAGGGQLCRIVKTPAETYGDIADKAETIGNYSWKKTLFASFKGGCYVGMAGLLSIGITGNMGSTNLSLQRFVFAALFPVNLLLVLQTACQLFTGNTATMTIGMIEGRTTWKKFARNWVFSYIGNVLGCGSLAVLTWYTGLLSSGTASMALNTAVAKCSYTFGHTVVKAVMCNWLVCMAVYLATSAQDLGGKMVGIWFPISMFVAIGFEHSVANMFTLPAGLLAGAPLTITDVILKNLIPVTIGNIIGGAVIVGMGFALSFGKWQKW
jgi:formate/nitrite transporter